MLKKNYEYFQRFLQFMPDILKAKKELAPDEYVETLKEENVQKVEELPLVVSTDNTKLPHAPKEIAQRFLDLLNDHDMDPDECQIELNKIVANYNLDAIIFEGDNHKKGL